MHESPAARVPARGRHARFLSRIVFVTVVLGLAMQSGCLFRKRKAPAAPKAPAAAPTRIAFLPLNVPQGLEELHWIAVAEAVMSANVALAAPDLEPVPLWESMPAAIQSLGNSRTVTEDVSQVTATRLSARWASGGEIKSEKSGINMRLDFDPSRSTYVPFQYQKTIIVDKLVEYVQEAYEQFLRYLIVGKLQPEKIRPLDAKALKSIAEAVDAEYGWFAISARPGAAGPLVESLARSHPELARLLFNPAIYPVLAK